MGISRLRGFGHGPNAAQFGNLAMLGRTGTFSTMAMRRRVAGVVTALALVAGEAVANDGEWQVYVPQMGGTGAAICPLDSSETGNFFCIALSCEGGDPLALVISYAGGALPDRVPSTIYVDGQAAARIDWPRTARTDYAEHLVPYDPGRHGPLIAAMRAGQSAEIVFDADGDTVRRDFALRGAARSLDAALEACPVGPPRTGPAGNGSVASERFDARLTEACGGGYTLADGALLSGRLDGDAVPDLVLDWSGVRCADASIGRGAGYCGAALCRIDVYLSALGGSGEILGVQPELVDRAHGMSALRTTTMGDTCGGPGQVCEITWIWTGETLEARR
jgi:hypothetical protein